MAGGSRLVTGTDFICVPTNDFEESRRFYAEVLGLEPSSVWQRPGEDPVGAEFETGNLTIAIVNSAKLGMDGAPHRSPIEFRVDDVAAARRELESQGVEFKGEIIDSGVCHQTFFEDPAGNALGLHHRYAPRS
jgi:catechol 2,3-dioxygenase-like lactoylglutathione lyase family enzyme